MPRISVIIPSYNHAAYIEEAVRSVLAQTEPDLELVVVDDGSRDNSLEVLGRIIDPRIRVIAQTNQGAHAAINRGLQEARAETLAILNSDDAYEPRRLEKMLAVLSSDPEVGLVSSNIQIIDEKGKPLGIKHGYKDASPWKLDKTERSFRAGNDLRAALLTENYLATTSNYAFSRRTLEKVGIFRALRYTHDWDFALRVSQDAQLYLIPEPLLRYRVHGSNTIRENQAAMILEICWILAVHLPKQLATGWFKETPDSVRISQLLHSIYTYNCEQVLAVMLAQRLDEHTDLALGLLEPNNSSRKEYLEYIRSKIPSSSSSTVSEQPPAINRLTVSGQSTTTRRQSSVVRPPSSAGPALSIIMPCYNRDYDLSKALQAYNEQNTETPFEVIAIDDGSNDRTLEVLKSYQPTRYKLRIESTEKNAGPAAARNRGIELAKAPIILFVGDDILPDQGLVEAHLDDHDNHPAKETVILGRVIWANDMPINTLMRHIDGPGAQQFSYQFLQDGQQYDFRHFYTANVSIKREMLDSVETWFDVDFPYAAYEDAELSYRLSKKGMVILHSASPLGYHYHYHNIWTFTTRQFLSGQMACILVKKHPELTSLIIGDTFRNKLARWRLTPGARHISESETARLEDELLHALSAYEWHDHPNLDSAYLETLSYYYFKGVLLGTFGDSTKYRQLANRYARQKLLPALKLIGQ